MRHWFKDSHFRLLLRNSSFLAAAQAVTALSGIITSAFTGHALGAANQRLDQQPPGVRGPRAVDRHAGPFPDLGLALDPAPAGRFPEVHDQPHRRPLRPRPSRVGPALTIGPRARNRVARQHLG